jgi:predicted GIY-YIG superfamily endonuclease
MRKKRSDRNHIVYQIVNKQTEEFYIGITALQGRAYKFSIQKRWKQHISRAKTQDLDWTLCNSIRQHGPESFDISILEVIRGKSEAHSREVQLIRELKPQLNLASNK